MKVVFAHDYIFYQDAQSHVYSSGRLPYSVWQRYLEVFSHVTVAARFQDLTDSSLLPKLSLSEGPGVDFLPIPSLSSPIALFTQRTGAMQKLEKAIAQADAVIARLPSEIGALAIEVARRLGKPWAVEMVACAWDALWNYGNWQGKVYAPIMMYRTQRQIRSASHVLYVTKQFLQHRYPTQGLATACSDVRLPSLNTTVLESRLAKIAQPHTPLTIGLIGSLNTQSKGVQTALKALSDCRHALPAFEFRVLGEGQFQSDWQALAQRYGLENCVRFCGALPGGDPVLQWLDAVDLYIQPSFQEGLPRALVEAMSRGCPALGSTAGGIPELLSPDCLHPPGNSHHLAKLIVQASQNPTWQLAQAQRNFQIAKDYTIVHLDKVRRDFWHGFAATPYSTDSCLHPVDGLTST
jgi:glycosyltransferase involved in cell wall biosynthesis